MIRSLLLVVFILLQYQSANACDEVWLDENIGHGKILKTSDGAIYEIDDVDTVDTSLWLPVSDLLVCSKSFIHKGKYYFFYDIINLDDKEKVTATKLR
jgi:hypothetical protein